MCPVRKIRKPRVKTKASPINLWQYRVDKEAADLVREMEKAVETQFLALYWTLDIDLEKIKFPYGTAGLPDWVWDNRIINDWVLGGFDNDERGGYYSAGPPAPNPTWHTAYNRAQEILCYYLPSDSPPEDYSAHCRELQIHESTDFITNGPSKRGARKVCIQIVSFSINPKLSHDT
jgi:hypothetical protein